MNCQHKNCTRIATIKNTLYFPEEWLCTYHANIRTKEGRQKRKHGIKFN